MAHQIAKLMLEHAETFLDRTEAVKTALHLGMPLREIEEYLDWLETNRPPTERSSPGSVAQNAPRAESPRPKAG